MWRIAGVFCNTGIRKKALKLAYFTGFIPCVIIYSPNNAQASTTVGGNKYGNG